MLLRFKIGNFLSFYKPVEFDMFPNPKRERFIGHIYTDGEIPLLKLAAIYGANGSGKSNFIKALSLIRNIAVTVDFLEQYNTVWRDKFRLMQKQNDEPIYFSIEFFIEGKYFIYTVSFDENSFKEESLYESSLGHGENRLLFIREGTEFSSPLVTNEGVKKLMNNFLVEHKLSSLLALLNIFPVFDNIDISLAKKWFRTYFKVYPIRRVMPELISRVAEDDNLLIFINEIFSRLGLGINKVNVEKKEISEILDKDTENMKEVRARLIDKLAGGPFSSIKDQRVLISYKTDRNGNQVAMMFSFTQSGLDGYDADMDIQAQSDGTVNLLNLLPVFYDIKKNESVYIIDEIENSIHPALMVALIKYFSEMETKGQLIFTTHETELLNQQEIMRPDEVWFTEKRNGCTQMYSLNDFKLHNTINIRNGYLEGRFGAVPFIGDLCDDGE